MMYRVAIVEDETQYSELLQDYLERFGAEKGVAVAARHFSNAVYFLEKYRPDYDIVFMDIQMPYLNGMDAAHRLRELDSGVLLIFITHMGQYAIQGYSVDAFDYVLKPVSYPDFSLKMSRALRRIGAPKDSEQLVIDAIDGKVRVPVSEIRYIESMNHHLLYHVGKPETVYTQYGSMNAVKEKLLPFGFARAHNSYLVNLRYVQKIAGYTAVVDGVELPISQPRKKAFVQSFTDYAERKPL